MSQETEGHRNAGCIFFIPMELDKSHFFMTEKMLDLFGISEWHLSCYASRSNVFVISGHEGTSAKHTFRVSGISDSFVG